MSVGYPVTKADVDSRAGGLALALRNDLDGVTHVKFVLDTRTDADLIALGYTSGEVSTLRSAYADLAKLADIYRGAATQATAYDFRTFAKLLIGTS